MFGTILKKIVFPIVSAGIMLLLFLPVCKTEGNVDYFLLWILVGIPYGVHRMCVWLIPKNYGISGGIGVLAFDFIIGGMIGGIILIFKLIKAIATLVHIIVNESYNEI